MKIAYLVKSISRKSGGVFVSCRRLAQTISRNHNVFVLGVADEFSSADLKDWAPLRPTLFRVVGPRNLGYSPEYAKALTRVAPDLAHVHALWTYPSLAGYLWHRRTKRPFIYSVHGMLDPWAVRNARWKKRLVRALWEKAAHRSAACFHVTSEAEYLSVRQYGIGKPICVIPNGIDLPERTESSGCGIQDLELLRVARGRKVLLYLGRLHPKKNLANLIRAWKQVLNSQPSIGASWILAVAGWGHGGYDEKLKQLASALDLSFADMNNHRSEGRSQRSATTDHQSAFTIVFLGSLFGADKDACYRACDAFVLPSVSEGMPMTVLEAWAYAKPILMTPECNLPQGFDAAAALQIGTSPEEIVTGLNRLIEMSDNDRNAMGARGHALVAARFSWDQIGQQMRSVYEWILHGGTAPETVRL